MGGGWFAWIALVGDWLDIGGNVPGNYNPKATESFEEGERIPPVKLARAGVIQQDVIDILAANSRVPQSNFGDLDGDINALDLGEKRLHALLDDYGDAVLLRRRWPRFGARAKYAMCANIAALPRMAPFPAMIFCTMTASPTLTAAHLLRPHYHGRPHDAGLFPLCTAW